MSEKRVDESQDAFVIRCIRNDEAEACRETIEQLRQGLEDAWPEASPSCVLDRVNDAIWNRIAERAKG